MSTRAAAELVVYFNPRSSCEERLRDSEFFDSVHNFNPRSSCEERRVPHVFKVAR